MTQRQQPAGSLGNFTVADANAASGNVCSVLQRHIGDDETTASSACSGTFFRVRHAGSDSLASDQRALLVPGAVTSASRATLLVEVLLALLVGQGPGELVPGDLDEIVEVDRPDAHGSVGADRGQLGAVGAEGD
jgi:hypothetical protein